MSHLDLDGAFSGMSLVDGFTDNTSLFVAYNASETSSSLSYIKWGRIYLKLEHVHQS